MSSALGRPHLRILGINDQHNASACLLEDGTVVAAIQEERLSRIKNHFCFPHRSIRWVLESTGVAPGSLDAVAISSEHISPHTREDLIHGYHNPSTIASVVKDLLRRTPAVRIAKRRRRRQRLGDVEKAGLPVARTQFVDHHTAHAAAAYHGSPWGREPVLVLTADGQGDDLSASVRIASGGRLEPPLATVGAGDSLGGLYSMVTYLMGMVPLEHEYKLMGMAPYASDRATEQSYRALREVFEFEADGLGWHVADGVPETPRMYEWLRDRLERHRFDGIAGALQQLTEEHLLHWVQRAVAVTGIGRVALGGGVFMNVKANHLISRLDAIDDMFVFPSCGDETNSMGAAYELRASASRQATSNVDAIGAVYWGPAPDDAEVVAAVEPLRTQGYRVEYHDDIENVVAELLASGEVVARVKGPMEFGARALGNRSILADPSRTEVVRIINDMIKNRDFWMPFAPAILADEADAYIDNPRKLASPHMMLAFPTTERVDELMAAVHPYDHTARPQLVEEQHNPDFYRLLRRFHALTGRAAVLNTSYNLHGSPIVCSAQDAVGVLIDSGLRHLALDQYLVSKPGSG